MIGYRVTATSNLRGYTRVYDGWSEGSPKLESKAKEFAAKQVLKAVLKRLAGGPVVTVADVVSKPLQGLGQAAGEFIAQKLYEINLARAGQGLEIYDVDVTLSGDFEGAYRVKDSNDLNELPKLLALIPAKGDSKQFMGESVIQAVFMAHANFARHLYNLGNWKFGDVHKLNIKIEL
jgi:hypothetical protein